MVAETRADRRGLLLQEETGGLWLSPWRLEELDWIAVGIFELNLSTTWAGTIGNIRGVSRLA